MTPPNPCSQVTAEISKWVGRAKMVDTAFKVAKDVEYVYENGVVAGLKVAGKKVATVGLDRLESTAVFQQLDAIYKKADASYNKADSMYHKAEMAYKAGKYVYEHGVVASLEAAGKKAATVGLDKIEGLPIVQKLGTLYNKVDKVAEDVEYVYENGIVAGLQIAGQRVATVALDKLEGTAAFQTLDAIYAKADAVVKDVEYVYENGIVAGLKIAGKRVATMVLDKLEGSAVFEKLDAIYNKADAIYAIASAVYEDVVYVYDNGIIAGLEALPRAGAIGAIAQAIVYVYNNGVVAGLEALPMALGDLDPKFAAVFQKAQAKARCVWGRGGLARALALALGLVPGDGAQFDGEALIQGNIRQTGFPNMLTGHGL